MVVTGGHIATHVCILTIFLQCMSSSVHLAALFLKCYAVFPDSDHLVVGMITRKDITEKRLDLHWYREGHNLQKFINVDHLSPVRIQDESPDGSEECGDGHCSADQLEGAGSEDEEEEEDVEKGFTTRLSSGGISLQSLEQQGDASSEDEDEESASGGREGAGEYQYESLMPPSPTRPMKLAD